MIVYVSSTQGVSDGPSVPIKISDFQYRSGLNLDCDEQRQLHAILFMVGLRYRNIQFVGVFGRALPTEWSSLNTRIEAYTF